MKYILITGVSTGIGQGILIELVKNGYFVFGTVRSKNDAERLKKEVNSDLFFPILTDVTDEKSIQSAFEIIRDKLQNNILFALINNAGILIGGPLVHLNLDHYRQVMEVNFFGTVKMMQTFIPLMSSIHKNKAASQIINISSVLGHYGLPYISTYTASKYAIEGFSDSVRREIKKLNINLVLLIPGAVKTLIFKKGANEEDYDYAKNTVFEHSGKNLRKQMLKREELGISSQKIGKKVIQILKNPNPKPRYSITGSPMVEWYWPKYLPDRILDFILNKILK
ncbi:MAG: SDR family NAD(P)-dependent oxidoreductase [Spirochaetia bacterium]|nr:SDR family NAD(P)-dependent oxidoreductase [Spirochaetia bacterium]